MTTVVIGSEVPEAKVAEVQAYLDSVAMRDVNWNGAEFVIERGDYTYIADDESANAVSLLIGVREVIFGAEMSGEDE